MNRAAVIAKIPQALRLPGFVAALSLVYIALEWVSSIHEYRGLPFTAWDPGLGVLFAALIRKPGIGAAALFAGVAGAEIFVLQTVLDAMRITGIALTITIIYCLTALLLTRKTGFDPALPRSSDTILLLLAGIGGACASAALLIAFLLLTGNFTLADIPAAGFAHIIGDTIGIAVVTPLALRLSDPAPAPVTNVRWGYAPDIAIFAIVAAFYYPLASSVPQAESHRYFYLLFVPAVFTAVRHGLTGASCLLAATQVALVVFLDKLAFDADNFFAHQTMMLVLTACGLLVGAIVSERNTIEAVARTARARMEAMTEASARAARFNLVNGMASALAHEISQPLTAARARARIVEHLSARQDHAQNEAANLQEQITLMIGQIDAAGTILQRMRSFLSNSEPERRTVAWSEIAGNAAALMEPMARRHDIQLEFTLADPALPAQAKIMCDPVQIQQVLANLIGNAIDAIASSDAAGPNAVSHRPPGSQPGRVEITASLQDGKSPLEPSTLLVSVRDNGPGVRAEVAARLFEPLVTTRQHGMGLGLAITAMIVESHKGRIWLESSRPGMTEFRLQLPLATQEHKV